MVKNSHSPLSHCNNYNIRKISIQSIFSDYNINRLSTFEFLNQKKVILEQYPYFWLILHILVSSANKTIFVGLKCKWFWKNILASSLRVV